MSHPIRWLLIAALAATATSSMSVYPHQLAYFNEFAGGPANGHKHLLHSNLDWGQDLLFVKEWYRQNGSGLPLYFLHYKYGQPTQIGLPVESPQTFNRGNGGGESLLAGFHVVSLNSLCGDEAYYVHSDGRHEIVSHREVRPYLSLRPVFRGGYSLLVFSVAP